MPPENGGKYEDLAKELPVDMRQLQEQQSMTGVAVGQILSEVSSLTKSVNATQRGQKAFNRVIVGRMSGAEDRIDAYEFVTARHRAEDEKALLSAVDEQVKTETSPGRIARRWTADPFVWAVIVLVGVIGFAVEGQWRDTAKQVRLHDKRLIVMETVIKQIPPQMQAQAKKIDTILDRIRPPTLGGTP